MKIVFTIHIEDKLKEAESKKLKITRRRILDVLNKPKVVDKKINPHQNVGKLSEDLSLSVIWKIENRAIKVVTYYPARKGRYESKILRGR